MDDEGLEETERSSKMNQVKTVENMMNKDEFKKCIERLKSSTMFHMSLGSKELFHSNFLHWISIVNWSAFLEIMHGLADTKKFWWEKIDENDPCKCPKDIKVFREHRNFDLSIYILDSESEKEVKEVVVDNNIDKEEDDNPTMEITHDNNGKRKVQKWIPVLVLENKMKSLPYKAQLVEYTQKAFEEWSSGKETRMKQKAKEKEQKRLVVNLNEEYSISYILLSLKKDTIKLEDEISHSKNSKKPTYNLTLKSKWIGKTYRDLLGLLKNVHLDKTLDDEVLKDYCIFVEALCGLADNWTIDPLKNYRTQIFPLGLEDQHAKEKIEEINNYKELRIHDIHEKIMYDQLLNLLESGLKSKSKQFERYNAKTNQENFDKNGIKIFTNPSYAHGIGIFEVQYFIKKNKRNDKESFFKLIIQVQGDRYCHMVINDGVVLEEKDENEKKVLRVNKKALFLNNGLVPNCNKLKKYISIDGSQTRFPISGEPSWGQYGKNNIYQYVEIPQDVTVQFVINAIITDIEEIEKWFKP